MATCIGGSVQKGAVTIASNGYTVGMNPVTNGKPKLGDSQQVSDRTMTNLYYYPPHCPEWPTTDRVKLEEQVQLRGIVVLRRGVTH
jgi:hypothetical protein